MPVAKQYQQDFLYGFPLFSPKKSKGYLLSCDSIRVYASTFPHCSMKSSEYLWPKTKRLVKDERRSKSKLRVCA